MYLNKAAELLTTSSSGQAAGAIGTTDTLLLLIVAYGQCTGCAHLLLLIP